MLTTKYLIEEEWEADDIVQFCANHQIPYQVLTQKEIMMMDTNDFFAGPFFCSTHIIQAKLKEKNLNHLIPDTYPSLFNQFYKRSITKCVYENLYMYEYPYFIKSAGNDKLIDGTVVNNAEDLANLWIDNQVLPYSNLELYISDVVKFNVEYRLFIGNNQVYAIGYQKGDRSIKLNSGRDFVDELLKVCKKDFYCIDVGYIGSMNEWAIVEVNPPFALDDYDILIDDYIQYNVDFWFNIALRALVSANASAN